jgi:hypothetical protein
MAVAGSLVGAWIGVRLSVEPQVRPPAMRAVAVLAAVSIFAMVGYALIRTDQEPSTVARVQLTNVTNGPERTADARVTFSPASAADDANWLDVTAWQGGGLIVNRLKKVGPGTYETTKPIPLSGDWKTLVRLHKGDHLSAVPIYLPADSAIPVAGVPAPTRFTRPVVSDHKILQREQKASSGIVTLIAYLVVASIAMGLLVLLAWGLHRLGATKPEKEPVSEPARSARRQKSAGVARPLAG